MLFALIRQLKDVYKRQEERRDYAVLRFVDQNGWSYMVNDYAKGCSLMEYIKQGIRVEKETAVSYTHLDVYKRQRLGNA